MQLIRAARRAQPAHADLCTTFCSLYIAARGLSSTAVLHAERGTNNATPNPLHSAPPNSTKRDSIARSYLAGADMQRIPKGIDVEQTPAQRAAEANKRAKENVVEEQRRAAEAQRRGGLAEDSIFADDTPTKLATTESADDASPARIVPLTERSPANMAMRLNPNPNARARWQRMMVIRDIRRRGRLTKEAKIARSERNHLSKSAFFKTSIKKLMPLARQIAGKSIDEAILQMRFSKKKAALRVRQHLVQARNEAVVIRGMGLGSVSNPKDSLNNLDNPVNADPSATPPLPHQNAGKTLKPGAQKDPTDIYISEAWVNRGPYAGRAEFRARGRVNLLRKPHTGLSVVLKEEKTRTREKMEKEAREIKRRMSKNMWTQLPDRPVTRQSQYVLW